MMTTSHPRILVLGLGNPILGDDGVGWQVAEEIKNILDRSEISLAGRIVEVDCLALGGLSLMERMEGYDRAILIDAISTGAESQGKVSRIPIENLPNHLLGHLGSSHDTTLQNALIVGRKMGVNLPEEITIIAVESQDVYDFSEELSPAVANAVPVAVELVIQQLCTG
jgi:hydrogenase maturation protease